MIRIKKFLKTNIIFSIATLLAMVTCLFVPITKEYINYFDFNTLTCLLCLLVVVEGLKNTGFLQYISIKVINLLKNTRYLIAGLIFLTVVFDLILANDMSLLTLLPFTYIVLKNTNNLKYLSYTLVLQTIAANMSGMIVPHGNPQNLYLYSYFNISTFEFIKTLLPQFLTVILLLLLCTLVIKKEPLTIHTDFDKKPEKIKTTIYMVMFVFSLAIVFRFIPYIIGVIPILIISFFLDKKSLKTVDYTIILTFCAFFIFSGNLSRINAIHSFLTNIVDKNVFWGGIISCQFISNVPTAILLSKFTENYRELLISVNIGSLGTMISSLASLITLKEFLKHKPDKFWSYLGLFTLVNIIFFVILLIVTLIVI